MSSTATRTTAQVSCPMHDGPDSRFSCGGELVEADYGTFASTQVTVAPCSSLVAQGWPADSPQLVLPKSTAGERLGLEAPAGLRHTDGLVIFA